MNENIQALFEMGKIEAPVEKLAREFYEDGEPAIEQHKIGVCCSKCMKMPKDKITESDYCPNCGAKMDGGKENV